MRLFNFLYYVASVAAVMESRDSSFDNEVINSCNNQLAELADFSSLENVM